MVTSCKHSANLNQHMIQRSDCVLCMYNASTCCIHACGPCVWGAYWIFVN